VPNTPLAKLGAALLAGATRVGVDAEREPRFLALRSLDPGSVEPAVHQLWDLVAWLAAPARRLPRNGG